MGVNISCLGIKTCKTGRTLGDNTEGRKTCEPFRASLAKTGINGDARLPNLSARELAVFLTWQFTVFTSDITCAFAVRQTVVAREFTII